MMMEKKLADYLPLYLGCEVLYGKEVWVLTGINGNYWYVERRNSSLHEVGIQDIKPILRSLSDMTEEESIWVAGLTFTDNVSKKKKAEYGRAIIGYHFLEEAYSGELLRMAMEFSSNDSFELTRYLLSKGFDLFGLIEAGLAIDKTKQNDAK